VPSERHRTPSADSVRRMSDILVGHSSKSQTRRFPMARALKMSGGMSPIRSVHVFVLALTTLTPPLAIAADSEPALSAHLPPRRLPIFGVMGDAGLPDGLNASVVVRPLSWMHAHAGFGSNGFARGYRAGISVLPLGQLLSLSAEAGRYGDGDVSQLVARFAGNPGDGSSALKQIRYDYANAHIGLDMGKRRAVFFIHGGISLVRATLGEMHTYGPATSDTEVTVSGRPTVHLTAAPTFKVGLIVYFI
jgi:hypothetical protein